MIWRVRFGIILAAVCLLSAPLRALAIGEERYVDSAYHAGDFKIVAQNTAAPLFVDSKDHAGVVRAVSDLQKDIERVTNCIPSVAHDGNNLGSSAIITGTIGKSEIIDHLIRDRKIDITPIAGKWESFLIQVVSKPLPGVTSALVIAGSDKRGTIYGIYDLSDQIGVSPWYWWADVPVPHQDTLSVRPGRYLQGPPAVKYRGIFLNDEAPSLTGWVKEKFGTYNHEFYTKVFELLLRLKANYLWPAMWNNAFNEDDPLNPRLADEYGIVMGTSHHEPMLRAQQEWKRHGHGPWDYSRNADVLHEFWDQGVQRNKNYESIITLGMRGDGDLPMTEGANIALLEKIVADQRKLIAERVNPDLGKVQQDWALYKEVQEYYEKGMRVPDDVTLLWCDDNWGNIRRLPTPDERKRKGGAGVYYHFDYVGGPRNYKWINTNPIPKVWEQMNQALSRGADRIWIVNVGDLKPMEFPIEFFLNLAWAPDKWPKEKIGEYTRLWAEREFGPAHAREIADIISKYTKYNGRRKPELLEPTTFSQVDYQESEKVAADFHALAIKAEGIYRSLPENQRDAFFQLVLYPAKASSIVTELYVTVGKNRMYASQGRASANDLAAQSRALFQADADLAAEYNHTMAQGKWDHMMDQTHIGYTAWNDPKTNSMPKVAEIEIPAAAQMGVAVEGSESAWPGSEGVPVLPGFDAFNRQRRYIDVFNKGSVPFTFSTSTSAPWLVLSSSEGRIEKEQRLWVSIDWKTVPQGAADGSVKITTPGQEDVVVKVRAINPHEPARNFVNGFVEADGYVSIEAEHYTRKTDTAGGRWEKVEDYGRTLSSMMVFPSTARSVTPPERSAFLEYKMYLFDSGAAKVEVISSPTQNFVPGRGLRYAIAFDDLPLQTITALAQFFSRDWATTEKDSVRKTESGHTLSASGVHTLKVCMVDPGMVLQKIVVNMGGERPSYLGPPESYRSVPSIHSRLIHSGEMGAYGPMRKVSARGGRLF